MLKAMSVEKINEIAALANEPHGPDTARLADKVRLHDVLKKGLHQLKLA